MTARSDDGSAAPEPRKQTRWLEIILAVVIGLLILGGGGWYAAAYGFSPAAIRQPAHEHAHYRLILLSGGKTVDFGQSAYQTDYNKDMCSAALTKEPVHFHDGLSQYGHIHWAGITGGLILKNYGWDLVGGLPGTLGYRFDQGIVPRRVPVHSETLPTPPAGAKYYVYTGTAASHSQRSWNDFLNQPMTSFLKGTPVVDTAQPEVTQTADQQSARTNDVLGNIVIFAQKDEPTPEQITAQFNNFKPLPESPCEG